MIYRSRDVIDLLFKLGLSLGKPISGRRIVNIFLPINSNMCFGFLKEPVLLSTEDHMFWLKNDKLMFKYAVLPGGLDSNTIYHMTSRLRVK